MKHHISDLDFWNLFSKLDWFFSTSASLKESGAVLIIETGPAWYKALAASTEKLERKNLAS
jgi:hypothetical protein